MTVKEIKRYKLPIMKKLERRGISTYEILAIDQYKRQLIIESQYPPKTGSMTPEDPKVCES